jgi:ABC-type bacteriocin/lantibiotic exporter with double-glycine peptidase domain
MRQNPPLKYEPLATAADIAPRHCLLDFPLMTQKTNFTCGPAVVSSVTKYFKIGVSEHRARIMMDTSEKHGTTPEKMRDYLKYLGIRTQMRRRTPLHTIKAAIDRGCPVILLWNDWKGHWACGVGYGRGYLLLADPANRKTGLRVHLTANFRKHWHATVAGTSYRQLAIICGKP